MRDDYVGTVSASIDTNGNVTEIIRNENGNDVPFIYKNDFDQCCDLMDEVELGNHLENGVYKNPFLDQEDNGGHYEHDAHAKYAAQLRGQLGQ